ncbi:autotransporter outer membrane beta-barrel domain-containing protein [Lactiplantibacillus pentosus]|uniref:Peptidase S74 domain-containing protein n=1 Tax=Lactiplantibacillus pentosus TaxID=1589 RepID=A0AB37RLR4_LACPE|nr:hypothetical protein [Lactiplantibacillus pentosus]RMW44370.1 hypothetical protein D6U20_10200 [Lactiplantibacillus pentosus]RMW44453.1 hypothetical protein D6U19_11215 [Lactiplantibacillus pentosus]RMW56974.1 hypothetical protein D6U21_02540 [Lactiplantibacillus pentosus]RMW57187.1 hypothetical protein D6U17_01130 [Lactiplantibacillus pentosus]USJ86825.1 hypothetical protein KSF55_02970 [Lactiplantibacillus pentosus]
MATLGTVSVSITDASTTAETAQATADTASTGVTNLNTSSIMSVIEKQQLEYSLTVATIQYTAIVTTAKSSSISTTALTTAYNAMNTYESSLLADLTTASTVDRDNLTTLQSTYNTAYSNVQTLINDSFSTSISEAAASAATASTAASTASAAATSAGVVGSNASSTASVASAAASQASADYTTLSTGVSDGSLIHITTKTAIDEAVIGTAELADAAITNAKIGSVSASKLTAGTIDFSTITGTNINATNITTGTLDVARLNVGSLSALSADLGTVTSGTIKGNTITGGTISGTTITGTVINGGTINSGVINSGTKSTSSYNTGGYYPLTINASGVYTSTMFDSSVGLQAAIDQASLTTSVRYFTASSDGTYYANQTSLSNGQLTLTDGYTAASDNTFSSGVTATGSVSLSSVYGINLYGNMQTITFNGLITDTNKGITFTTYGNIKSNGDQGTWYVGYSNDSQTANFGIDSAGSNPITFSRELWVSNMGLGLAHQIRSKDGGGIYFTDDSSARVDTYHKNIYYSGSSSKSLLSEKTNVEAADINYWSNLAMSIDLATYNYDTDDYTDPLRLSGIIDDVNATKEWTLPEAFYARDEDGNIVGIDNGVLLNAVLALSQEQARQIDALNTNVLAMEAKING